MIHTRICEILGVRYPIALGGMPTIFNSPALVAAVSDAGAMGIIGCTHLAPAAIAEMAQEVRARTNAPFALNALMFLDDTAGYRAALAAAPAVVSLSWPRADQDLGAWIGPAQEAGAKVMVMAGSVPEAVRAAEAGAEIIVAQGTEGGGHVGWIGGLVLVPMVVDAVAPVPVMAAGGIADGRGLAAALALGAEGVVLGTRFLASAECGLPEPYKQAILASDGHDTVLTEIPDMAAGQVWPGAMSRVRRNRLIERWSGREWALRAHLAEVAAGIAAARRDGDAEEAPLFFGQDAGLIHDAPPAGEIVDRLVRDAAEILAEQLPGLTRGAR